MKEKQQCQYNQNCIEQMKNNENKGGGREGETHSFETIVMKTITQQSKIKRK